MKRTRLNFLPLLLLGGITLLPVAHLRAALLDSRDMEEPEAPKIDVRFDENISEGLPSALIDTMAALKKDPENADLWVRLGDYHMLSELPAKAAEAYWRAARIQPDHPQALKDLGVCFLRLRDFANAETLFEALRIQHPDDGDILMNLGAAYHGMRKYKEAETVFSKLVENEPDNDNAVYNLAVIMAETDRVPEAILLFKKAYGLNSKSPLALFAAARAYARLNQPEPMYDMLKQALTLVPSDQAGIFLSHPVFAPWKDDPEFRALLTPRE